MTLATPAQLARAQADGFHRDYRVLVGPRRAYVTAALFTAGEPVTLPVPTYLTGLVGASSTTIPVSSTVGYPTSGMLALTAAHVGGWGPTGWFAYTGTSAGTFTGVTFLHGTPSFGPGARVVQWQEITDLVTEWPAITEAEQDYQTAVIQDWTATLRGVGYRSDVLLPDATVVILERVRAAGSDTGWLVAATGYVRRWEAEGDAAQVRRWQATVESVSTYINRHRVAARQWGRVNLADGASVSASAALGNLLLEPEELAAGAAGTDAANVTDGNPDTGYISSVAPTATPATPTSSATNPPVLVDAVFCWPPAGGPADLQYVVLRLNPYFEEADLTPYALTNRDTLYSPSFVPGWPGDPFDVYVHLDGLKLTTENPTIVLCRNRQTFEEWFGASDVVTVYDWRYLPHGAAFRLDPSADAVRLRLFGYSGSGIAPRIEDEVAWGTMPAYQPNDATVSSELWSGAVLAAPAAGTAYRRSPPAADTDTSADWATESPPVPTDPVTTADTVYLSVDLGEFSVNPASSMTAGSPATGASLTLTDATPLDAAGTVQIDAEQITYTSRDDTTLYGITRGANGTTAASHTTGDLVYHVSALGEATRHYSVGAVEWRRRRIIKNFLLVVPKQVQVWGSRLANPTLPGGASWELDWLYHVPLAGHFNGGAATIVQVPLGGVRLRHVMLRVVQMSDGGRAKIDDVYVWRGQLASGAANDEEGAGAIARELLEEILDAAEITIEPSAFTGTRGDRSVSEATLGQLLQDLLVETMGALRYTLDGRVVLARHPAHPLGARPDVTATLTAAHQRSPQTATNPSRLGIGQVVATLRDHESGEQHVGRYPPVAGPGEIVRLEDLETAVTSPTAAAHVAQTIYLDHPETSRSFSGGTAGPAEWLHVGQRVYVADWSDAAHPGRLYNCRITGVTHGPDGVEQWTAKEWRMP